MSVNNPTPDPITGTIALSRDVASVLLRNIISDCKGQRVLFDLDSTLLNNRPRSVAIMREFAESTNQPLLSQAAPKHFPTWSARDSMVLMGIPEVEADGLLDEYLEFWAPRFFSSEYCVHDVDIVGAVKFVNAVDESEGEVIYLTGRDETMRAGTTSSLLSLGFPPPGTNNTSLVMKPNANDSDDTYKRDKLESLSASGNIAAAFDNEPAHINSYRSVFPNTLCVHLDTDHSMREVRLLDGIVSIKDFDH